MLLPRPLVLSLLLAVSSATAAFGQDITLLTQPYVERLDEKALPVYREGVIAYDRVNYDRALNLFFEAMQLDPRHVKLRLLVGNFAMERGKMKHGEEALRMFNVAREAFERLVSIETLKPEDRRRAETDLEQTRQLIANLPKRDTQREATGMQIIQEVAKEREESMGLTPLGWRAPGDEPEDEEEGRRGRAGAGAGAAAR